MKRRIWLRASSCIGAIVSAAGVFAGLCFFLDGQVATTAVAATLPDEQAANVVISNVTPSNLVAGQDFVNIKISGLGFSTSTTVTLEPLIVEGGITGTAIPLIVDAASPAGDLLFVHPPTLITVAQTYSLSVSDGVLRVSVPFTVSPAAATQLAINPTTTTGFVGSPIRFGVQGFDQYANIISPVNPLVWTSPASTTLDSNGVFTSPILGTFVITAETTGAVRVTAAVTVRDHKAYLPILLQPYPSGNNRACASLNLTPPHTVTQYLNNARMLYTATLTAGTTYHLNLQRELPAPTSVITSDVYLWRINTNNCAVNSTLFITFITQTVATTATHDWSFSVLSPTQYLVDIYTPELVQPSRLLTITLK